VFKNTLARRAMDGGDFGDLATLLEGPVAIAFVKGDAAAAAKALRDFARANPALVVKGGLLGTTPLVPGEIEALADLPSRDVLLAQIAGAFQAPLVKAAGLFQALPRNLAYGVKALIDQRVAGGEAGPDDEPAAGPDDAPVAETADDAPAPPADPGAPDAPSASAGAEPESQSESESE
jgi:large subunit ribosomal protein L10